MLKNIGKRTFSEIMDDPTEIFKQHKMQRMLSEDGTLKYDFMFSLQKIAMAKIMSNLWITEITKEIKTDKINKEEIKAAIVAKISRLLLPNHISQQLQDFVVYFGESIVKWIEYHNYEIFCSANSAHSAADLISDITWTVRGKIDYGQTAKKILANQGRLLSDDCKYKLACMYCLEDEIAVLAPKITANKFYLSDIPIDIHPMVYFWTAHFTGDNTLMNDPFYEDGRIEWNGHMSINEYIMLVLVHCEFPPNHIAISYMWNKLNVQEREELIVALIKSVRNPDVIFSVLSDIQYDLQQKVFKECSAVILKGTLDEWWWWGEYFLPTLHYTLNIMHPESYWQVLVHIYENNMQKFKYERKHMYDEFKSLFKGLWRESSFEFKDFVFQLENEVLVTFLAIHFCWTPDIDVFELILNDLSPQNKKIIFSEDLGINICAILIQNDKWNLLDLLFKDVISSEEDINQLKERLITVKGSKIVAHFLQTDAYDALQRFIRWAFKSKEDVWKLFKH